jgi:type III restriction enzyme
MKFNFKIQQFQTDAVESLVQIFAGQPYIDYVSYIRDLGKSKSIPPQQEAIAMAELADIDAGFRNEDIHLTNEDLLNNIRRTQTQNNIHLSDGLIKGLGRCSLDIEMETGTGKTYVYIKSMFELNKRYGWSKFIVVVPSIAIREGVKKSFETTESHFMEQYGKKARFFIYDSHHLEVLDDFSSDPNIHVMIINTQAFAASLKEGGRSKESRIIYSERDEFRSRRPIDVIKVNRPILILDEPQKMGGEVTQKALKNFNPLFSMNYSATHKKQHNLIYVLDALDAYNQKLVKKIEVKGFEVKNLQGKNKYLYLESIVLDPKKPPRARIEIEVAHSYGIKRELHLFDVHDDLQVASNLDQYKGYTIAEINPLAGTVAFTNGEIISKGEVIGDVSEKDIRRIQIRETILSHFQKEERLFNKGIKTLSLFFIDEVAKYRQYDKDGQEVLGEYGVMFEEEYLSVLNEYQSLFDSDYMEYLKNIPVESTHKGYFSIDKKTGHAINSKVKRNSEFSDDISAYDLILKNKERLLSFEEPTRFIFSHSALREGWDNPNVFQICALKHSDNSTPIRQEVGRGLRLCVNQDGNRMDKETCGDSVQDLNVLTVIASDSYSRFVNALQEDITKVLYDRPTKATEQYFTGKTILVGTEYVEIDSKKARAIYRYLLKNDYVDEEDHISQNYRDDLNNGTLQALPIDLQPMMEGIHKLIQGVYDPSALDGMISNGHDTKIQSNPLNDNFHKKQFQTLWKEINHHYAYTVQFDSQELIKKSIVAIDSKLSVSQLQYTVKTGQQVNTIDAGMVNEKSSFVTPQTRTAKLKQSEISQVRYDLLGKIASETILTRRTTAAILQGIQPHIFAMFKQNPEEFINKVTRLIKEQKATMIVEHITYNTVNGTYDSSIFTAEKNNQNYDKAFKAKKSIQDYVFTDGMASKSIERKFAEEMDNADEVCVYAKLPKGFYIPTPLGHYSPDWAIVFNEGKVKHIYFVAETKGSMDSMELRQIESAKIECAKKLFKVLSNGKVTYDQVDSYGTLLNKVMA